MSERHPHSEVRTEIVEGRVPKIVAVRREKKNAFTPEFRGS